MGYSFVGIKKDHFLGEILVVEGERRKGGCFVEIIEGVERQYGEYKGRRIGNLYVDREGWLERIIVPLKDLGEGYEILFIQAGGSRRKLYRDYYLYDGKIKELKKITEEEMREILYKKLKAKE